MTCALKDGGQVWCWGDSNTGLGDAAGTEESSTPVRVDGISGAKAVAVGDSFACAIGTDGNVLCWGYNGSGQLGDGTTDDSPVPVSPALAGPVSRIVAGKDHACALRENGDVFCWGDNDSGQLGDGTTDDRETPVLVSGVTGSSSIAAGEGHSCAVLDDGTVKCWGANDYGQIGLGNDDDSRILEPVEVAGALGDAVQVAAGDEHSCALQRDGRVACWGEHHYGQTGFESPVNPMLPATVPGLENVGSIAAGGDNSCAVRNREVHCWGTNDYGQLGEFADDEKSFQPVRIAKLEATAAVSIGRGQLCATTRGRPGSDVVRCWGYGEEGQLGNGKFGTSRIPVPVNLSAVSSTASGVEHNCALLRDDTVNCWGRNRYGQLGVPGKNLEPSPVPVPGIKADLIASNRLGTCAVTEGPDGPGRKVSCWGYNDHGQLGTGDLVHAPSPVEADLTGMLTESNSRIIGLVAGSAFNCALKRIGDADNGMIWCWGRSDRGQTAPGVPNPPARQPTPAPINRPPTMLIKADQAEGRSLVAGDGHACAIGRPDGRVWCWGGNTHGQVGDGTSGNDRNGPVTVQGLTGAVTLAAGSSHTCALTEARKVMCWGNGSSGQLGDGASTGSTVPVEADISDVRAIAAGQGQTCAVTTEGAVYCWGTRYDEGFQGDQASWTVPRPMAGATNVASVALGDGHGCYVTNSGQARCWVRSGLYYQGMHGDGPMPSGHYPAQAVPTPVTGFEPPARPAHPRIELRDSRLRLRSLPLGLRGAKPCPKRVRAVIFQKVKVKTRRGRKIRKVRVVKRLKATGGSPCLVSGAVKTKGALRKAGKVKLRLTGNGLKPLNRKVTARHTVRVRGAKLRLDRFPVGSPWPEGCPAFARVAVKGLARPARGVKKIRAKAPVTFAPEAGCQVTDTFRLPKKLRRAARLRVTVTGPDLDPVRRKFRP